MSVAAQKKAVCKAALVNLDESASAILRESFRQFRISAVDVTSQDGTWLSKEKFDAGVVRLEPGCETLLEAMRSSPRNRHMVIYGISMPGQHLREVSKYGINVMLMHPLDRQSALKVVRSTHLLVLHEFRRYVRIPIITEISMVTADGRRFTATSQEISTGGMSVKSSEEVSTGTALEVSFALLTLPRIWVRAQVSWTKPDKTFGLHFDSKDERRLRIKDWIVAYLEG